MIISIAGIQDPATEGVLNSFMRLDNVTARNVAVGIKLQHQRSAAAFNFIFPFSG